MMDYTNLLKGLLAHCTNNCSYGQCPFFELDDCSAVIAKQAADAINDLSARKVGKWIPATEQLPEKDGWYQVYAPSYSGGSSSGLKNINGNMYSAFKHGKWSIEVGYHKRPGCVKAWMPLPEPPKEETE